MRYRGTARDVHVEPQETAVLLANLGTPDAPDTASVRRYLAQFLSDPRVIELPRLLWLPLLYGIILPLRSPRSARAYAKVWTEHGSPLRMHSERLAERTSEMLAAAGVGVRLAMRYGRPSIASVLQSLSTDGLRRLLVLPLYPHYSATTTASVFDAVTAELRGWRWLPEMRWVNEYQSETGWIDAIARSIRSFWVLGGRGDRLLFSFHGLPKRYVDAGDPYFEQCHASARRIAAALDLPADAWALSFQSRVGREDWLHPYTDAIVADLGRSGVERLDVVCPGFAVDCLETLEEIAMDNAQRFRAFGGAALRYIPALNASDAHARFLADLALRHLANWPRQADCGSGRAGAVDAGPQPSR